MLFVQCGENFFCQCFVYNDKMLVCISCYIDNLVNVGQYVIIGKVICLLVVVGNFECFVNLVKVEKWFGCNCKEVVGCLCILVEKVDFVIYMSEVC